MGGGGCNTARKDTKTAKISSALNVVVEMTT